MIKKTLLCSMMVLGLLGMTQNGQCGPKAGEFTISPMIGGHIFEDNQDPFNETVHQDMQIDDGLAFGLGLGYQFTKSLGVELMANLTRTDVEMEGVVPDPDMYVYPLSLNLVYNLTPDSVIVPYVEAGAGMIRFCNKDVNDDTDFMMNYGAGLKYYVTDSIALRADVRHLVSITANDHHNHLLYSLGLVFGFGGEKEAAAPVQAKEEEKPVEVVAVVVEKDSDGDGVLDSADKCADTPGGVKVDAKGCPVDSDKDGVTDDKDQCADTPKGVKVNADGCPADSDNDGVTDDKDKCPNTAAGTEVDEKGCPVVKKVEVKDTDKDGVTDDKDKCANTPEGANVNINGCWVVKELRFDLGKTTILAASKPNVDEVVVVMQKNPEMKLEIQGYTDNSGSAKFNQKLSEKRAIAVMEYIKSKGIAKDRMTAKGYGIENPAETNDTEEGRALNRRVELKPVF
ncbi:MAG: OmpA family protein [Desulfobacteraceae bacterium]|jgi:OOP family OmpA-OmpF porin